MSIADVSFSIHSSASATIKRLMHFLKTKVGFLRTCTIALAKASLTTHIFLLGYMYQKKQEYTRFSVKISWFSLVAWRHGILWRPSTLILCSCHSSRARNITLSKLEWNTEKCSDCYCKTIQPFNAGLLESPELDSGASLVDALRDEGVDAYGAIV